MKKSISTLSLVGLAICAAGANVSATEVFQNTSVTLGVASDNKPDAVFGSGTSDKNQTSVRLEHFGVNGIGDNYFFADVGNGKQVGGPTAGSFGFDTERQTAVVWNARASYSKISGNKLDMGVIDDVSLMYRLEVGSYANYTANMIGPSFNLKVPGFAWFQTSFLYDQQTHSFATDDDKKGHLFWHTYAILPFDVGSAKFTFSPLLWVNYSPGANGVETYVEPDLWVKVGQSPVDVGLRVLYHSYNNYSRTTPTLMARINF